jgi:carbamoyltransferase
VTILGISAFGHDAAAAILVDGRLIAACEEERLSRVKHDGSFPERAIRYCLQEAGIRSEEVDYVGFYHNPWLHIEKRLLHGLKTFPRSISFFSSHAGDFADWGSMFAVKKRFPKARFEYVEHHRAHAAGAFYPSLFDEAAILSVDGMGEWATTLLAVGKGKKISSLESVYFPHSLGIYYEALTQYLGFRIHNDEYKVMGLSAYGTGRFEDSFRRLVRSDGDGGFELDLSMFAHHLGGVPFYSDRFVSAYGAPRENGESLNQRHADLAFAGQRVLENALLRLTDHLFQMTGKENLCIAGGVGLNCVANGRIFDDSPFKRIYVQPASYDSGCAIGCCYHIYHELLGNPRRAQAEDCFLGPSFGNDRIEDALHRAGCDYRACDAPEELCGSMLAEGKVVGWFQGRMEFGPRALGARSILANPLLKETRDRVNVMKNRESFRPFAPSVLEERAGDYFQSDREFPHMLFVRRVREEKKNVIPSVTHVDGTARIQTVSRNSRPQFYGLIARFEELTGVPVVLNTSFNLKGEPIVCTPEDALKTFLKTGLDGVFLGDYFVSGR